MIRAKIVKGWCRASLLLIVGAAAGCDYHEAKTAKATPPPPDGSDLTGSTFATLSDSLFTPFCIGCHSVPRHSAGVDLGSFEGVTGKNDEGESLVKAGDKAGSLVYQAIASGRMPPAGAKPDGQLLALLGAWIDAGASATGVVKAPSDNPTPTPTPTPVTFDSLSAELFQGRCVACHAGADAAGGVHLDDFAAMTSPNDEGELVVAAGKPDDSLLVKVLEATDPEGDPPRMPPDGPAVDAGLAAKVRAWVAAGAPAK